jgi:hypothetical protein
MQTVHLFTFQGQVQVPAGAGECEVWSKAVDSSYNVQARFRAIYIFLSLVIT